MAKSSSSNADRDAAFNAAMARINKQYGDMTITNLSERRVLEIETYPSGSMELDLALGVGGIPKGKIIEIYGPESSGKTTLSLSIASNVQKAGGRVAFIDAEHALDPEWAEKIGVDLDRMTISQPDNGEQALEITEMLVNSGGADLIIVDSVAAMVPKKELEGDMGDSHVGLQARLMSQALRKLTGPANVNKTTIIFINQLREKIGVMFGSPETTTGGKALKFYASIRLDIRRIETLKNKDTEIGNKVRIKIVKNKVAPPFKKAESEILFGVAGMPAGFSRIGGIIDLGVEAGLIKKSGAWYTDVETGDQLGQGKEKVREYLSNEPAVADAYEAKIREKLFVKPGEKAAAANAEETADDE